MTQQTWDELGGTAAERRVPRRERSHRGQHRTGHRGQDRDGPAGARRPARRGPPPDRGRSRRRQDQARQGAGPLHRLLGAPHPVHPRPAAQRRHRRERLQPGEPRLRVQAGRGLRQPGGRRRDQPGLAEDPVGAAGVHGGASGHGRRHDLRAADAVHGDRDAEPDRDGGHLPAARGAARPVHRPDRDGLPGRAAPSWPCSTSTARHDPLRRPARRSPTRPSCAG